MVKKWTPPTPWLLPTGGETSTDGKRSIHRRVIDAAPVGVRRDGKLYWGRSRWSIWPPSEHGTNLFLCPDDAIDDKTTAREED